MTDQTTQINLGPILQSVVLKLNLEVLQDFLRFHQLLQMMSFGDAKAIISHNNQQMLEENMSNYVVSTVPVDGLALSAAEHLQAQ